MDNYLISEYIYQCKEYRALYARTAYSIRIQTYIANGNVKPVLAFIRYVS